MFACLDIVFDFDDSQTFSSDVAFDETFHTVEVEHETLRRFLPLATLIGLLPVYEATADILNIPLGSDDNNSELVRETGRENNFFIPLHGSN